MASSDLASIGDGTIVEEDVCVGWRYHSKAGPTRIGKNGILRKGTIIYGDVDIGDYFQSGHYVVIRAKIRIGNYCAILNHSVLEGLIRCGDGVRIMSHVYVPSRTWFGDRVFVGPNVTFLNDRFPARVDDVPYPTPQGATVEDDVMIGGGCTVLPGIRIGERSFIAAGSVVTKDVPPRSFVVGAPGRIQPLPAGLDRPNCRAVTIQPIDLWHPATPDLASLDWPPRWNERFRNE